MQPSAARWTGAACRHVQYMHVFVSAFTGICARRRMCARRRVFMYDLTCVHECICLKFARAVVSDGVKEKEEDLAYCCSPVGYL